MRQIIITSAVAIGLAACGPTASRDLYTPSQTTEVSIPENYQAVYRRVSIRARECLQQENLLGGARWTVDAQLYGELGYGEVTYALSQFSQSYIAAAKIAKDGTGARVTIAATAPRWAKAFEGWARGGSDCG